MGSGTEGTIPEPGNPSHTPGMSTYTDERTGLVFASESVAKSLGYGKPIEYTKSKVTGEMVVDNGQMGSQWWMDTAYDGPEPDLATKLATTGGGSADYSRDWIGTYVSKLVESGMDVSRMAAGIANEYPEASISSQQVWAQYPAISPSMAVAVNHPEIARAGTIAAATPSSNPGSTSEPSYMTPATGSTSGPQNTATTTGGTQTPAAAMTSALGQYGIYIIGVILALMFVGLITLSGNRSGVPS